jgi:hypothetical protein
MAFYRHAHRFIFRPEPLESRTMLSGNGFLHSAHLGAQLAASAGNQSDVQYVSSAIAGANADHHGGCGSHGTSTDGQQTSLTASLTDPNSAATGTATYSTSTDANGDVTTNFNVSVSGAAANSTLDVAVDGTVVGQLTTDENGAGALALSSNPTGTEQALPADFPASISDGSVVTAGSLSGTLSTSSSQRTSLAATLTDSTGTATASATFKSNTANGKSRLSVSVSGATANSTLDVSIDGTVVGQLTTDSTGAGSLVLSSNPTGTQQAFPTSFTGINSGSTVTVGSLTGTFATSGSSGSSAFFGAHAFGRRR